MAATVDSPATPTTVPQPTGAPGNWSLKFDDEFNGTSLNKSKWTILSGDNNNVRSDADDVRESGGVLILTLSRAGAGYFLGAGPEISSSPLLGTAKEGFDLPVGGFMEAAIDFPGSGSTIDNWPAFWASTDPGSTWPADGEEDVFEGINESGSGTGPGEATTNYVYSSNETANPSTKVTTRSGPIAGTWANGFHTYGLYRGKRWCLVFWDGRVVAFYRTHDLGGPQQILLTLGSETGPEDNFGFATATGAASEVKVNYVRVWVGAS